MASWDKLRQVGTKIKKKASWDKTGQVGTKIGKSGQSEDKLGHNQEMKGYYGHQRISQWNPLLTI